MTPKVCIIEMDEGVRPIPEHARLPHRQGQDEASSGILYIYYHGFRLSAIFGQKIIAYQTVVETDAPVELEELSDLHHLEVHHLEILEEVLFRVGHDERGRGCETATA